MMQKKLLQGNGCQALQQKQRVDALTHIYKKKETLFVKSDAQNPYRSISIQCSFAFNTTAEAKWTRLNLTRSY